MRIEVSDFTVEKIPAYKLGLLLSASVKLEIWIDAVLITTEDEFPIVEFCDQLSAWQKGFRARIFRISPWKRKTTLSLSSLLLPMMNGMSERETRLEFRQER